MTSNKLIKIGSDLLKKNNIKSHLIDAELILSSISGQTRENFLTNTKTKLNSKQIESFNKLIQRRALRKEPIAYLLHNREFWSLKLNIDKNVLIPRPETEELVDLVLQHIDTSIYGCILDIGTGSGCIAIALKKFTNHEIFAIDYSNSILNIASNNAKVDLTSLPLVTIVISIPLILSTLSKLISGNIICSLIPKV